MKPVWEPSKSKVKESVMAKFMSFACPEAQNYKQLHRYSIEHKNEFWKKLCEFFDVSYEGSLDPSFENDSFIPYSWFPNLKLNFAENLLKVGQDLEVALNFVHESGLKKTLTFKELRASVSLLQKELKKYLSNGDVLAAYMPNCNETVVAMLGATSLGGVFTSTSCDFGVSGVVDRFGQSRPKVLVAAAEYQYNGKVFSQVEKIKQIVSEVSSIEKVYIVNMLESNLEPMPESWQTINIYANTDEVPEYVRMPFASPLYIMYSSGTTGKPKCIVHSIGGTLLQHLKEIGLHTNVTNKTNIMYFTTCGWMMWNWLVSSLALGATVTLYEGSPGFPSLVEFFKIIEREKISVFGTSPKFLKALEQELKGSEKFNFSTLNTLLSTGAPLLPEQFDFIYKNIKTDVQVASICGGTDIVGCFMLGNPLEPVYRGEIQGPGLGMEIGCFDENGTELVDREGELVCKSSFPSSPVGFLNDPDYQKFHKAYFDKYSNIWHHGDYITLTSRNTVQVFGRSDATLNPGGVRIGTSEIYRQVEKIEEVKDSICVGKQVAGDVEVWLFVLLKDKVSMDERLGDKIKKLIRQNTTPRHVPKKIVVIKGIPYTRSGKKMEMAVTKLINGKELDNIEAVANPECLAEYRQ
jgi:acetoacetyl-CoA synthetase